jgi:hypothetical protein
MTPQQRSDLYARMNADLLDVMDLIVRKAGEEQRQENSGSLSRSHASHEARSGLRPSGFDRGCKKVSTRDGECANNGSPTDND